VEGVMKLMQTAVSASEMRSKLGIMNASKFKKKYLDPLIELGVIKMTRPEMPNSRLQQYVLTEAGKRIMNKNM
jgi:hypothetical protein